MIQAMLLSPLLRDEIPEYSPPYLFIIRLAFQSAGFVELAMAENDEDRDKDNAECEDGEDDGEEGCERGEWGVEGCFGYGEGEDTRVVCQLVDWGGRGYCRREKWRGVVIIKPKLDCWHPPVERVVK